MMQGAKKTLVCLLTLIMWVAVWSPIMYNGIPHFWFISTRHVLWTWSRSVHALCEAHRQWVLHYLLKTGVKFFIWYYCPDFLTSPTHDSPYSMVYIYIYIYFFFNRSFIHALLPKCDAPNLFPPDTVPEILAIRSHRSTRCSNRLDYCLIVWSSDCCIFCLTVMLGKGSTFVGDIVH